MRVIQKTIVDFDTINSYARTLEFLGSKKAASDLRNIKQDILSAKSKEELDRIEGQFNLANQFLFKAGSL